MLNESPTTLSMFLQFTNPKNGPDGVANGWANNETGPDASVTPNNSDIPDN
jgi:hypothetical protein